MKLQKFTYEFDPSYFGRPENMEIRVVTVGAEPGGSADPWFVAKDVAVTLGYTNHNKAVIDHCKYSKPWKELKGYNDSLPLQPALKLIPESDLYRLIMRSDMEEAERFQDWVCEEVLPTIRKTGVYHTPDVNPDFLRQLADKLEAETKRADEAERTKAQISDRKTASAEKRKRIALEEKYKPVTHLHSVKTGQD